MPFPFAPRLFPWHLLFLLPTSALAQFTYTSSNNEITITGYTGPGGAVIIPTLIDGLPVTGIGYRAFAFRGDLTEATIPSSVTNIGAQAFLGCKFATVTVPASVLRIDDDAFRYCAELKSAFFEGNSPSAGSGVFTEANQATIYYLPQTLGWGSTFAGRPTALWN